MLQLRHVGEATPEAVQQRLMKRMDRWREGIVTPQPVLAHGDEPRLAQMGQMPGNSGLWDLQDVDDVPDTEFAINEDVENPQTVPVGKCPEQYVQLMDGLSLRHIRRDEYIALLRIRQAIFANVMSSSGVENAWSISRNSDAIGGRCLADPGEGHESKRSALAYSQPSCERIFREFFAKLCAISAPWGPCR